MLVFYLLAQMTSVLAQQYAFLTIQIQMIALYDAIHSLIVSFLLGDFQSYPRV